MKLDQQSKIRYLFVEQNHEMEICWVKLRTHFVFSFSKFSLHHFSQVVYLAAMIRSIIALHNLINNKITNRDAEKKEITKSKVEDKPQEDKKPEIKVK